MSDDEKAQILAEIEEHAERLRLLTLNLKTTGGLDGRAVATGTTHLQTGLAWLRMSVTQPKF